MRIRREIPPIRRAGKDMGHEIVWMLKLAEGLMGIALIAAGMARRRP
jgi:hypothetical protein